MIQAMVIGSPPTQPRLIVWRSEGIDKAQRRSSKGGVRERTDDGGQRSIARESGQLEAAYRRGAFDERLRIATLAHGSRQGLGAAHPPNRQLIHADAYRGIHSP